MGLEPTRCCQHKILSLARLPVPTLSPICIMILTKQIEFYHYKSEMSMPFKYISCIFLFISFFVVSERDL